ncbi:SIS domain-containing protein [Magnetovibrio sp.]|uniref:D-sedoheptulose-7-phosphate isomerase n=1 Tax=Magnetovibrio sp. TaxID=2024836 RepID=UPI002F95D5CB
MKSIGEYLRESAEVINKTTEVLSNERVEQALEAMTAALSVGNPLLVCGNGGSAADAIHITAELVGRFLIERKALNCICLSSNPGTLTAWTNDYGYDTVFSRQVEAYGKAGGVILGISTSGNSPSVVNALRTAREMNMVTIALTGEGGGKLAEVSDIVLSAPSTSTPQIQQVHLCIYHYLCAEIEQRIRAQA